MTSLRQKDFEVGVPHLLALKFEEPKEVTGKYGTQFLFTTNDDRGIYLDPEPASDVRRAIREHNIRVGEEFKLTRCKTTHGGHRWVVEPALAPRQDAGGYNAPHQSIPYQQPAPPPPMRPRGQSAPPAGSMDWDQYARSQGVEPAPLAPAAPTGAPTAAARLMACYMAAIDTMGEAQAYATRKGMAIAFTGEDVRSTAISLWISDCKGGR